MAGRRHKLPRRLNQRGSNAIAAFVNTLCGCRWRPSERLTVRKPCQTRSKQAQSEHKLSTGGEGKRSNTPELSSLVRHRGRCTANTMRKVWHPESPQNSSSPATRGLPCCRHVFRCGDQACRRRRTETSSAVSAAASSEASKDPPVVTGASRQEKRAAPKTGTELRRRQSTTKVMGNAIDHRTQARQLRRRR
jgi:hypothetical protein